MTWKVKAVDDFNFLNIDIASMRAVVGACNRLEQRCRTDGPQHWLRTEAQTMIPHDLTLFDTNHLGAIIEIIPAKPRTEGAPAGHDGTIDWWDYSDIMQADD